MSRVLQVNQQQNQLEVEDNEAKPLAAPEGHSSDNAVVRALTLGRGEWKLIPSAVRQHLRHMFTRLSRLEGQVLPPNWEEVLACLPLQERVQACERRIRSLELHDAAQRERASSVAQEKTSEGIARSEAFHEALLSLARKTAASVRTLDTRLKSLEQAQARLERASKTPVSDHGNKQTSDEQAQMISTLQQRLAELERRMNATPGQRSNEQAELNASERALLPSISRLDQTMASLQSQLSDLLQDRSRQEQCPDKTIPADRDWQARIPALVRDELRAVGLGEPLESTVERYTTAAVQALREEMRTWIADKIDREYLDARLGNRPSKASVMQAFQKLRDAMRSEMQALEERLRRHIEQGQQPVATLERYRLDLEELEARCRERSDRAEHALEELYHRFELLEKRVTASNHDLSSFLLSMRSPTGRSASQAECPSPTLQPRPRLEASLLAQASDAPAETARDRQEREATPPATGSSPETKRAASHGPSPAVRFGPETGEQRDRGGTSLASIEALQVELDKLQRQLEWLTYRRMDADLETTLWSGEANPTLMTKDLHSLAQGTARQASRDDGFATASGAQGHRARDPSGDCSDTRRLDSEASNATRRAPSEANNPPDMQRAFNRGVSDHGESSHPELGASSAVNGDSKNARTEPGIGRKFGIREVGVQPAPPSNMVDATGSQEVSFDRESPPHEWNRAPECHSPAYALNTSTPSAATWYHRRASIANSASKQCEDLERSVLLADPDEALREVEAAQVLDSIDRFLTEWRNALQERSWARSVEDENSRAIGLALAEVRGYLNAEMCAERGLRDAAQRLFTLAHTIQNRQEEGQK
ncbi:hypothetical protein CCYA_CCYA11G3010 [Cyanidiococcus yangmingshanensis]|nr:hypothetical protein CCYA_CCYA11G3010 [Cyanidiococcus yangmingshanensis]